MNRCRLLSLQSWRQAEEGRYLGLNGREIKKKMFLFLYLREYRLCRHPVTITNTRGESPDLPEIIILFLLYKPYIVTDSRLG